MKLSEQLRRDHDSGDFGKALEGYAERAEHLEMQAAELAAEQAKNVGLREALESAINGLTWWMDNMPHDVTEADYEEMDALQEALTTPSDTSALEAIVKKAGEVMRERCRFSASSNDFYVFSEAIRAIPAVTLEDLK